MRSSAILSVPADNSGFSRSGAASFGLASGALLAVFGAAPAHAQIYNANLTTSAANPNIFFSTTTGASSFATFTGATHELSFVSGSDDTVGGVSSTYGVAFNAYGNGPTCSAVRFAAGGSVDASSSYTAGGQEPIDTVAGWSYPGSGYVGAGIRSGIRDDLLWLGKHQSRDRPHINAQQFCDAVEPERRHPGGARHLPPPPRRNRVRSPFSLWARPALPRSACGAKRRERRRSQRTLRDNRPRCRTKFRGDACCLSAGMPSIGPYHQPAFAGWFFAEPGAG